MSAERIEKAISSGFKGWFRFGALFSLIGTFLVTCMMVAPVQGPTFRPPRELVARICVDTLRAETEEYFICKGSYPGVENGVLPAGNAMPKLLDALVFHCDPKGARFLVKDSDVAVPDSVNGEGRFRRFRSVEELRSADLPKYLLDPWRRPYVYRLEKSPEGKIEALIYSVGRNGKDESDPATRTGGDDLGNW
jgi:hypothetical protein